jgi:hypothetical protein
MPMMTSSYPQEDKPKRVSWVSQAYQRIPWLRVRYGRQVKPQRDQVSNLDLANDQVMRPREESVTHSFAFPLSVGEDGAGEETYAKK